MCGKGIKERQVGGEFCLFGKFSCIHIHNQTKKNYNHSHYTMFYARNPCLFEQLPAFQTQSLKQQRARSLSNQCATPQIRLNITTTQTEEGALVTLKKPLEQPSQYNDALEERVAAIKEKYASIPQYSLVSDMFGNQYYMDNSARVQSQLVEELRAIDMTAVSRKLAKQAFRDYTLELSHDGSTLSVSSKNDNEERELQFGGSLQDFFVKKCTVEDGKVAVLQIGVVLEQKKKDSLDALIDWAQQSAAANADITSCAAVNQQKKVQKAERRAEAIRLAEKRAEAQRLAEKRAENIRLAEKRAEAVRLAEAQRIAEKRAEAVRFAEAQHIAEKRAEAIRLAEIKQAKLERAKAERIALQRAERERAEKQSIEEQRQRIHAMIAEQQAEARRQYAAQANAQAQANAEAQEKVARERTLQEQAEYQRQLVKEERAQREKRVHRTTTPPASPARRSSSVHASPVLEDVDDEETRRYNASMRSRSSSTGGYTPVIDDM